MRFITDEQFDRLLDMPTLASEGVYNLKIELAGIRVWLAKNNKDVMIEKMRGGYYCVVPFDAERAVLASAFETIDSNSNKSSNAAEFVTTINFDIDSLASVIAEQSDDTVVELVRRVIQAKNSRAFRVELFKII